ncbi:MAG: ABC transporter ATP-binding protein [Pseudomonadota bacterium]
MGLWFWQRYLTRTKGLVALAFVLMVVEGSTLGALSYLLKPLFDQVFADGGQTALALVGLGIVGLFAVRGITSLASKTLLSAISQTVSNRMQADLLDHVLTLDGSFFQAHPPGALIERVQGDTMAVQGIWISLISGIGRDAVALIGLMVVALSIDPLWTLAALIGAPLLILPTIILQRYLRRKAMQLREQAGLRTTRLDEIFHGIQAVKLNGMESYQSGRFRRILDRIRRAEIKATAGRATMPSLVDLVTGLGFFAVLMMGGSEVASGERTTGEFMAFFSAMTLTFQPIRRMGDMAGLWQTAAASLERIVELFDTRARTTRPAVSLTPPPVGAPALTFDDVGFAYGDLPVLNGLSFTAEAGRMTALVGPSGAGKTTIFQLLTGLADPMSGTILAGDVPLADLSLPDQRALFATVTQDSALFDETLRENLTLGRDIPAERLEEALTAAHAAGFVGAMAQGIDTAAGPRGSSLSGGQRQRIAIARALLREAPVLLLDEATSALDAQSEALVADALAAFGSGRTTLVIAHRLATVRDAHKIVVIDKGRVVEEGNHAALLAQGGLYARLHDLQFRE